MGKRFLAIIFSVIMVLLLPAGAFATDIYGSDENGTIIKIDSDFATLGVRKCESIPITVDDEIIHKFSVVSRFYSQKNNFSVDFCHPVIIIYIVLHNLQL